MIDRILHSYQQTDSISGITRIQRINILSFFRMGSLLPDEVCNLPKDHPHSILEVGVRYGYSAITFLKASENATYLGIDSNSDSFGRGSGAIDWARNYFGYSADFMIADTKNAGISRGLL